jgi:hypothetical protein
MDPVAARCGLAGGFVNPSSYYLQGPPCRGSLCECFRWAKLVLEPLAVAAERMAQRGHYPGHIHRSRLYRGATGWDMLRLRMSSDGSSFCRTLRKWVRGQAVEEWSVKEAQFIRHSFLIVTIIALLARAVAGSAAVHGQRGGKREPRRYGTQWTWDRILGQRASVRLALDSCPRFLASDEPFTCQFSRDFFVFQRF